MISFYQYKVSLFIELSDRVAVSFSSMLTSTWKAIIGLRFRFDSLSKDEVVIWNFFLVGILCSRVCSSRKQVLQFFLFAGYGWSRDFRGKIDRKFSIEMGCNWSSFWGFMMGLKSYITCFFWWLKTATCFQMFCSLAGC